MRLFVAVTPPAALCRRLAAWALEAGIALTGARWSAAENLHITLRFLGDLEGSAPDTTRGCLQEAVHGHRPFLLTLWDHDMPARSPARVAFMGLEDSAPLSALRASVSTGLEAGLGLERDARAYRPHITLARHRRGWDRAAREQWKACSCPHRGERFEVTYVDLMQSLLSPSGARYRTVERFLLSR